jgi:uncharacterized repeat protein (TIGR03803 family)
LFRINTSGNTFTIFHSFGSHTGYIDGDTPSGSPTLSGASLYGMTFGGGTNGLGTLYRIDSGGTNYGIVYNFAGGTGDGSGPVGSPTVSGSTIYGMTISGGSNGKGTVFKIDSTGHTILHNFASGTGDGATPEGSLTLSGSTLYGVTFNGGSNWGVVFKINTDGTAYTILHNFVSGDGANAVGTLALSGSTLYGMTAAGGGSGANGTVFKINTDGTGYAILHKFVPGSDGYYPLGSLTLSGSTLYGMASNGGSSSLGVMFQVNTDGTGYTILHNFAGGSSDGANPDECSLTLSGSTLFGMTRNGGSSGYGTMFSFTLPSSATPGLVGNVSTRLPVGKDDNALIEGFIMQGPAGSTKKIMVRAIGPSLARFGITDALPNPILEIHDASGATVATNDNWKSTQPGGLITGDQSAEIDASGVAPGNDLESAIVANLAPGSYTAVVRGSGNTVGTGVVDAYDLSAASPARLANIATRGLIQPGDKLMIAGFIVQNGPVKAVIRAIGPSLSVFGITNALADTTLQLRDVNGAIVRENDNWKTDQKSELENTGLQPTDDLEAALVETILPGQYTAQVRGKNDSAGIGVVQVYFLQ